jgi:hypothetical protein
MYFFEKFYVDGEEEIVMRRSGFIFFCPVDNFNLYLTNMDKKKSIINIQDLGLSAAGRHCIGRQSIL